MASFDIVAAYDAAVARQREYLIDVPHSDIPLGAMNAGGQILAARDGDELTWVTPQGAIVRAGRPLARVASIFTPEGQELLTVEPAQARVLATFGVTPRRAASPAASGTGNS